MKKKRLAYLVCWILVILEYYLFVESVVGARFSIAQCFGLLLAAPVALCKWGNMWRYIAYEAFVVVATLAAVIVLYWSENKAIALSTIFYGLILLSFSPIYVMRRRESEEC